MAKSTLPSDLEGAQQTGFLHGTRQRIVRFRAEQYQYRDKTGKVVTSRDTGMPIPPSPCIVVVFENPETKARSTPQKYGNGSHLDRRASEDGSGFIALRDEIKHALVKNAESYKLLSSIAAAGFPPDKLAEALRDYRKFENMVVDVMALPVGRARVLPGEDQPTIPVVGQIVSFPDGRRNPAYEAARVHEEGYEAAHTREEEEPAARKPADEEDEEPEGRPAKRAGEDDPVAREAAELVADVLLQPRYKRKGIDLETLADEIGEQVNGTKRGPAILKLVQDVRWLKRLPNVEYDAEEQTLRVSR